MRLKQSFFEKKDRKTFGLLSPRQRNESLLLLFFRKEGLCYPLPSTQAAYAVLAGRVAADAPFTADLEARVLGCWSIVHGLACLQIDGRLKHPAAQADQVTRSVALAMLSSPVPAA